MLNLRKKQAVIAFYDYLSDFYRDKEEGLLPLE